MDINNLSLDNMEMYCHGRMNFMVGLCEQLRLPEIFNSNLEKSSGRKPAILYGVAAEMMIDLVLFLMLFMKLNQEKYLVN